MKLVFNLSQFVSLLPVIVSPCLAVARLIIGYGDPLRIGCAKEFLPDIGLSQRSSFTL